MLLSVLPGVHCILPCFASIFFVSGEECALCGGFFLSLFLPSSLLLIFPILSISKFVRFRFSFALSAFCFGLSLSPWLDSRPIASAVSHRLKVMAWSPFGLPCLLLLASPPMAGVDVDFGGKPTPAPVAGSESPQLRSSGGILLIVSMLFLPLPVVP